MEGHVHSMTSLFAQLGLPSAPAEIQAFIESRRPLAPGLALHEAPFWTPSQAGFLREEIQNDADWADIIDELDSGLRRSNP
ncbi:hypothetical protein GETHLI_16020 [Geothrix limicola]|uniref:DUF2789 domain-containing protein n=1 Tax=Geothrix limicola TaxID=2927978 RepID=A0ABQ5QG03_9BACT|nr:DUF2789 domain-containing protein [Geothrix limicola]GLH73100.1 hypothetical protein GETHLI_16020 [Geothrix limicola]